MEGCQVGIKGRPGSGDLATAGSHRPNTTTSAQLKPNTRPDVKEHPSCVRHTVLPPGGTHVRLNMKHLVASRHTRRTVVHGRRARQEAYYFYPFGSGAHCNNYYYSSSATGSRLVCQGPRSPIFIGRRSTVLRGGSDSRRVHAYVSGHHKNRSSPRRWALPSPRSLPPAKGTTRRSGPIADRGRATKSAQEPYPMGSAPPPQPCSV
jgi:hypothetical protein